VSSLSAEQDAARSARLTFVSELESGQVDEAAVLAPDVLRLLRSATVPAAPIRFMQRLLMKVGRSGTVDDSLRPFLRARRRVLGERAAGPPRLLVRVDEFPHCSSYDQPERYGLEASRRFHDIVSGAGVAYLMSVLPQLTHQARDPVASGGRSLNDAEVALLAQMQRERVTLALHGLTHRTRDANPRRRSELGGLGADGLRGLLDRGIGLLRDAGVAPPRVFVPPFNRFDADQWPVLAERFDVVGGGPESVPLLGFHRGPLWRGEAVFLPCYFPLYARARELVPVAERLIDQEVGTWVPIVLHVGWEADDGWESLSRLASLIAPHAVEWDRDFLAAVERSA
jgi:hypothetical protein